MTRQAKHGRRALVVEDDASVRSVVTAALERDGFLVEQASGTEEARARFAERPPDVVVLDVELPDGNGLDLLREIVASGSPPVVVISGRDHEIDRVLGLELGAEDYVVKPFYPRELVARVRRASGRSTVPSRSRLEVAGLIVDCDSREVRLRGSPVPLTGREFDLLAHLAASPRRVFSREELLRDVWQSSSEWQSARTVTEHIRRLRQKLEEDPAKPRLIVTVGNAGYRLDPNSTSDRR